MNVIGNYNIAPGNPNNLLELGEILRVGYSQETEEIRMKSILALATVAAMAISAPACAQSQGAPGATGATGPLSGHNPPGSGVDNGMNSTPSGEMQNGEAPRMNEGRAAAPSGPTGEHANDSPETVRGDQSKQDQAK